MTKKTVTDDISESEGIRRLRDKAKKMKNSQIVPPINGDEPAGLLSGGPKSLVRSPQIDSAPLDTDWA